MGLTNNSYIEAITINVSEIRNQDLIKRKQEYIKFLCDCIYENKLENVITFNEYCEVLDLEQRHIWECNFKNTVEENKDWY